MKKSVLAVVAVLSLGLVSCDRDERVLEVEKVVEKVVEVEKPSALIGTWNLVGATVNGQAKDFSKEKCLAESVLTFTEDTYTANLSDGTTGACRKESRTGKYIYGKSLKMINLIPDNNMEKPGTYSAVLEGDKVVFTFDRKDGKGVHVLTFQKAK